ncbi:MAG: tRNA-intron lyase [Thermoplasmatales archaeon]|nr:tRNA-intron lyase [Thermoplasmatales archaeon]
MPGELREDAVIISDQKEGCQIYNKGNYGYPMSGGGLELDLIEATFLLESGRLGVTSDGAEVTFPQLFDYSSGMYDEFDIKYMVYRDIRQRGFVVKMETGSFDMSVFPRGKTMSNSRPAYLVRAVSERSTMHPSNFGEEVAETSKKDKKLLYGVVDEEGDLTYYIMSPGDVRGSVPAKADVCVEGKMIRDRVFVFGKDDADRLKGFGFFGKDIQNMLQLSLIESCYLMRIGGLAVRDTDGDPIPLEYLIEHGRRNQDEFDLRLRAYEDLRSRGLIVKTGFKYGSHFRMYEKSPDELHARYLAHAVPGNSPMTWPEISRAVRIAGGVKKEMIFCCVTDKIEYVVFKWFRL